jgi:hypothetical protein
MCHEHTRPAGTNWSFYVHDVHAWNGTLFVSRSRLPGSRWDVIDANPACPNVPGFCGNDHPILSWITHTGPELHAHSAWRLRSAPILLTADEEEGGHVRVWNVANLSQPTSIGEFQPDETCHSIHNIYSRGFGAQGDLCYAAWYNKGIQVFKLRDGDLRPYRVGYYEHPPRWRDQPGDDCCDPSDTQPGTGPCYGVPYLDLSLPSGHFIGTEVDGGLLVGRFLLSPAAAEESRAAMDPREGPRLDVRGLPGDRTIRFVYRDATSGGVAGGPLRLEIFDAGGRIVRSWRAESRPGDEAEVAREEAMEIVWDGRTDAGDPLPSGIYLARALRAGRIAVAKVLLLP